MHRCRNEICIGGANTTNYHALTIIMNVCFFNKLKIKSIFSHSFYWGGHGPSGPPYSYTYVMDEVQYHTSSVTIAVVLHVCNQVKNTVITLMTCFYSRVLFVESLG